MKGFKNQLAPFSVVMDAGRKEQKTSKQQEVTASPAAAKEIRVDAAAIVSVLRAVDIFWESKRRAESSTKGFLCVAAHRRFCHAPLHQ